MKKNHDIPYKTFMGAKPSLIRFDKIEMDLLEFMMQLDV